MATTFPAIATVVQAVCSGRERGLVALRALGALGESGLELLQRDATRSVQGDLVGEGAERRTYEVFRYRGHISRPVRRDLLLAPRAFRRAWDGFVGGIDRQRHRVAAPDIDAAIYSCVMGVACVYDLMSPGSRKTPGTVFEVVVAETLTEVSGLARGKQVAIPGRKYKVPTDLVLHAGGQARHSLVVASKITTRERVVQAWAQQRILDQVFGADAYRSILVCGSELQRDGDTGVKEICVPNQVAMFQEFLAPLRGMYYLDPPLTYTRALAGVVPVRTFGSLVSEDLATLLAD